MLGYIAIFVAFAVGYWILVATKHPPGFPDGPRLTLPVLGDGLALGGDFIRGFEQLKAKYGKVFGFYLGPNRTVVFADFDLIQEVGSNPAFQDRQDFASAHELRGGSVENHGEITIPGVLLSSGHNWVEQRRFALHKLRDLGFGKGSMESMISQEVEELCKSLEKHQGKPVNIRNDFNLAVLNSLRTIMTNERLEYDDPKIKELILLLDKFFQEAGDPLNALMFFYKPLLQFVKATNVLAGPFTILKILDLAKGIVSDHKSSYDENSLRDFTDHYLHEIDRKTKEGEHSSFTDGKGELNLANILIDLFIAGSETTSTTLNWGMLFMILNPDIQEKVQKELDEVTGRGRLPSTADKASLPYTEAVIHELQRCANITPVSVFHRSTTDAFVGGKYFIPKNTDIIHYTGAVMMDPKHFPNPGKFDPTRHLNKEGKFEPHPMIIPFGVGKRRCLGESLARMSLFLFFTGILSYFTLTKASDGDHLSTTPLSGGTLSPRPYKLRFVPRK